jgi:hypothetical protein
MKSVVTHLIVLSLVFAAGAEKAGKAPAGGKLDEFMESGMEVAGVRAPYYDDEGNLKAQIYGGYAKVLDDKSVDVTNMRIDVFEKRKVFASIFAPQCFTKVVEQDGEKILFVYSDGDVLIDLEQMTVTGKGFRFSSADNKFEIFHESKVLVKASARDMKGVEL